MLVLCRLTPEAGPAASHGRSTTTSPPLRGRSAAGPSTDAQRSFPALGAHSSESTHRHHDSIIQVLPFPLLHWASRRVLHHRRVASQKKSAQTSTYNDVANFDILQASLISSSASKTRLSSKRAHVHRESASTVSWKTLPPHTRPAGNRDRE